MKVKRIKVKTRKSVSSRSVVAPRGPAFEVVGGFVVTEAGPFNVGSVSSVSTPMTPAS